MKSALVFLLFFSISVPSAALVEEFLEDRFITIQAQISDFCTKDTDKNIQSHCFAFMLKPEVSTSLLHGEDLEAMATLWQSDYALEIQEINRARELELQNTERARLEFSQCTRNANAMNGATAENNARIKCFLTFKNRISFEQCTQNANAMNGATAENIARRDCFEAFEHRDGMSFEQCSNNANAMNGATAENNARIACFNFFKRKSHFTFDQCISNANRMNGATAENLMRTKCAEAFQ